MDIRKRWKTTYKIKKKSRLNNTLNISRSSCHLYFSFCYYQESIILYERGMTCIIYDTINHLPFFSLWLSRHFTPKFRSAFQKQFFTGLCARGETCASSLRKHLKIDVAKYKSERERERAKEKSWKKKWVKKISHSLLLIGWLSQWNRFFWFSLCVELNGFLLSLFFLIFSNLFFSQFTNLLK